MDIVICAIARFENRYVKEWVDYHLALGFSHIFIYDNNRDGEERIAEVLGEKPQHVTIIPFHNVNTWPQILAYRDCWNNYTYDWVLFCDLDEFFTFGSKWTGARNVSAYVDEYKDKTDAILLNWMMYGDNGELEYKTKPVIERFPHPLPLKFSESNMFGRQPANGHVKTLVKHTADFTPSGPHVGTGKYTCCNAEGIIVENRAWQPIQTYDMAYIRHYVTKTISEYMDCKMKREKADRKPGVFYRKSTFFVYNKPTLAKIIRYKKAIQESAGKEKEPLGWWIKQIIKHYIVTPFL